MPIVELMRVVKTMRAGDAVEVLADDKAFPADVTAWCKKTGHRLVTLVERGGAHVALVKKEGA
jgi:tRNA 2-thiouridine synthesizing protein A